MRPLLEVRNVSRYFGGVKANQDVSFSVEPGIVLGLIGPNGAGKTTLFNCITGFYPPSKGEILFDGQRINGFPPDKVCKLGMARTWQKVRPLTNLSVLDNVVVGALRRTNSVKEARESVTWSLFFIFLLYFTAPALAVLVKYEVFNVLVGTPFDHLPAWITNWQKVDPTLLSVTDINHDGIFQLGEMKIGGDIVVLATPEIGGLPYVVSGLVAAGGLAAALSTADGLLLTIANALSHDLYYKMIDPNASTARRVTISKALLLVVALVAAMVAVQKPADILFLVSAAFSFAAAAKRANMWGASLGMIAGLGVTFYYMMMNQPWLRGVFGVTSPVDLWWGIQPISAGLFGVPIGIATIIIVSLITPQPRKDTQELVEHVRYPDLRLAKA